ncbi:hypothetical protein KWC22_003283 [Salmonella enterica]|nr:hypothetical protein [Salmonella enterica]HAU2696436.1 hypothetical protein [Salmonella enterica subsp. diarizonae]HCM1875166.1 hypothetical protein [Salmonella enterica subsp. diarizonae serovar 53:z10:z35]EBB5260271.1 hypothetical protein [Salmonella enterica]EGA3920637.1 hypothetical protein [Salmonella enterica]
MPVHGDLAECLSVFLFLSLGWIIALWNAGFYVLWFPFYEDKNGLNNGHIPPGQAILLPDIPGLLYPEHPLFSAIFRHHAADRIEPFPLCGQ